MTTPYTGIAIAILVATNAATAWMLKNEYDAHAVTKFDLKAKESTIAAMELAAKIDAQEAVDSYETAQASCRQNIRAAVSAVRLPKVNPEVTYAPDNTDTPVCDCPSTRLSDIQAAGSEDKNVPAGSAR
jgi:hypothetical protein